VPTLTPVAWGLIVLAVVVLLVLSSNCLRLSRQRDDALDRVTQVLALAVFLRLASVHHYAEYVDDLYQLFGVADWELRPALERLVVQGTVYSGADSDRVWVRLTERGQRAAGVSQ
jgi:hypothetical protein